MAKKEQQEHKQQTDALIAYVRVLKRERYQLMLAGNDAGKEAFAFALQALYRAIPSIYDEATRRGVTGKG